MARSRTSNGSAQTSADLGFEAKLWLAADKRRSNMGAAETTADLQQRTHGTVFETITHQTFETFDCVFPRGNLTQAFDRTIAPLLAQLRANLHQSRTLRDTLLSKLLSGELSIDGLNPDHVATP